MPNWEHGLGGKKIMTKLNKKYMKLISINDAAKLVGVTAQTIRNWIDKGAIKVTCVGKARYVDANTLNALGDTIQEVEASRKALEEIKELYHSEKNKYHEMYSWCNDEKNKMRYFNTITASAVRTGFFKVIVELLSVYGNLTDREAVVLKNILSGHDIAEIANTYGLTKERVRQIAMKATRKSQELTEIKGKLDELRKKDVYIEELRNQRNSLLGEVAELQGKKDADEQMAMEEYISNCLHNDHKYMLLTKSIRSDEVGLSVRALNSLRQIDTLGQLASLQKSDLLKIRNLGKKTLTECDDLLERYGLKWGEGYDEYYQKKRAELIEQWKMIHFLQS